MGWFDVVDWFFSWSKGDGEVAPTRSSAFLPRLSMRDVHLGGSIPRGSCSQAPDWASSGCGKLLPCMLLRACFQAAAALVGGNLGQWEREGEGSAVGEDFLLERVTSGHLKKGNITHVKSVGKRDLEQRRAISGRYCLHGNGRFHYAPKRCHAAKSSLRPSECSCWYSRMTRES